MLALGGPSGALGAALPPIEDLLQAGFGILQVGTRACADPSALVTMSGREIEDTFAALDFLVDRAGFRPDQIGVFGFSMGAATAVRATARDSRIAAVIAQGGFHNLGSDFEEPALAKPAFETMMLKSVSAIFTLRTGINPWTISPIEDLPRIAPRPVLLIYGEHDAISGHANEQFEAAREPKSLWIVPGGTHLNTQNVFPLEHAERVVNFFESALLP